MSGDKKNGQKRKKKKDESLNESAVLVLIELDENPQRRYQTMI